MKILYTLFCITLFGCATFSKKDFRNEFIKLDKENIDSINGRYKLYPSKEYGDKPSYATSDELKKYGNLYQSIVNYKSEKRKVLDSLIIEKDNFYVEIEIRNRTRLKVSLFENDTFIKDTLFNGEIKNGMFYINNHYYRMTGIPYLVGSYESNKRRIGLSNNGSLIVNKAVSNEGAILLIIGTGHRYNSSEEFNRIN
jgi:hypothetical protein